MTKLLGTCNRCGLCCFAGAYRCINLRVEGLPGHAEATHCAVYKERYDGMPIALVNPDGQVLLGTHFCAKDSDLEDAVIIKKGIGKGCSLTVSPLANG